MSVRGREKDDEGDEPAPAPVEQKFVDPNARKSLTVFNPLTFQGGGIRVGGMNDDRARVGSMVGKTINLDPDFLKRYAEFFAVELTRRENLNAVLSPPANARAISLERCSRSD